MRIAVEQRAVPLALFSLLLLSGKKETFDLSPTIGLRYWRHR
jgi:hypothetical protein